MVASYKPSSDVYCNAGWKFYPRSTKPPAHWNDEDRDVKPLNYKKWWPYFGLRGAVLERQGKEVRDV